MTTPRLIIFDVDGTLVDSQSEIFAAMEMAHQAVGLETPSASAIRSIVGLSLPEGFAILQPELPVPDHDALADHYRQAYFTLRTAPGAKEAVFFPGMRAVLDALHAQPQTYLAVATGKSRRGLDRLIKQHRLDGYFISTQVCDDHPSKPHPSMVLAALSDCAVEAKDAVMIGDTTYDIDMAHAAGVRTIGVDWGYHDTASLRADAVANTAQDLHDLLSTDPTV